jgi:hypothetical protein
MLLFYMIATKEEQFTRLLSPVNFFLHLSRKAYAKYLANKIFLHAKNIRTANEKVCSLLEEFPELVPDELFADAIELVNHYGIWMTQFDEYELKQQPKLDDLFIFYHLDDQSAFPKEAEQHFFDYYNQVKKEIIL